MLHSTANAALDTRSTKRVPKVMCTSIVGPMRGLYAIIDPEACRLPPLAVAQAVLRGGCAALQLRAKQLSDADFLALGHALGRVCRAAGVPFFVNDRVWLARELGADGVHVGQDDQALE